MALRFSTKLRYNWLGHAAAGTPSTGGTLIDLLNANAGTNTGFWIAIFSGTQPANPEAAKGVTDVLLATIKGPAGVGCLLDNTSATTGHISKIAADAWSTASAAATGTAGWFRLYMRDNTATYANVITTAGVDETVPNYAFRIDGTCGSNGTEDLLLASSSIVEATPITVDIFTIKLPYAA